nr:RNA-directed DNA polymerase, eukaryota [Tanacetum cinerariifolium]
MNCLSLNIQGLGSKAKKNWIRELCNKNKVSFLSIQEIKAENVLNTEIKSLWGNTNSDAIVSKSLGNSGGLLCVWDPNSFQKDNHIISDNFIALFGKWRANQTRMLIVSVYAPQAVSLKRKLWSYLSSLINRWNEECIVLGDFNEVGRKEERWGSTVGNYI